MKCFKYLFVLAILATVRITPAQTHTELVRDSVKCPSSVFECDTGGYIEGDYYMRFLYKFRNFYAQLPITSPANWGGREARGYKYIMIIYKGLLPIHEMFASFYYTGWNTKFDTSYNSKQYGDGLCKLSASPDEWKKVVIAIPDSVKLWGMTGIVFSIANVEDGGGTDTSEIGILKVDRISLIYDTASKLDSSITTIYSDTITKYDSATASNVITVKEDTVTISSDTLDILGGANGYDWTLGWYGEGWSVATSRWCGDTFYTEVPVISQLSSLKKINNRFYFTPASGGNVTLTAYSLKGEMLMNKNINVQAGKQYSICQVIKDNLGMSSSQVHLVKIKGNGVNVSSKFLIKDQ